MHKIGTTEDFFRERASIGKHYKDYLEKIPKEGHGLVYDIILNYFAQQSLERLLREIDTNTNSLIDEEEFKIIDNGLLDRNETLNFLERIIGYQTHKD